MSSFGITTKVFFGKERDKDLFDYLAGRQIKVVQPIVDAAVAAQPAVGAVLEAYRTRGYAVRDMFSVAVKAEPTYRELDATTHRLRGEKPDAIIAIGGGSVIDLAKGIAVLLSNPGRGIEYRGMHKVKNAAVPLIAYPTTAGTGTEVTWTASFTDEDEGKKLGINGNNVAPLCGVLAPELVASAPRSVALSSGLDTLVHAIEAVTARTATPITAAMGAQAFAMMFEALPRCLVPDASLASWERAQLAAYIAGVAMMNAGGGPASGISYPLGVYYHVPHGFAGGIFLPGVFAFNVARGYHGYNCVYDLLPDADTRVGADRKAEEFVRVFREFYASVGGPEDLRPWGCTGDRAIEKLTELTITQRKENLDLNPVPFGRPDVAELLRPLCRG